MVARRTFDPKRGLATLLFLLLWLSSSVVLASPLGPAPAALQKRKPSFPSIDDCRAKFTAPPADKAMYFTSLKKYKDVQAAKKYANDHGLVHVSNSYPAQFTDAGQYDGTSEEKKAFQEAFSQVRRPWSISYRCANSGVYLGLCRRHIRHCVPISRRQRNAGR